MPETLLRALQRVRTRLRARTVAAGLAMGGAAFAGIAAAGGPVIVAIGIGIVVAGMVISDGWRVTLLDAARAVESVGALDNLVITAAELTEQPRPVRAEIRDAILADAGTRVASANLSRAVPLVQPALLATAVIAGCVLLGAGLVREGGVIGGAGTTPPASRSAAVFTVNVTPPAYTGRAAETFTDPVQITAIAGSRVRIESGAHLLREWVARESASLELEIAKDAPPRFLSVVVVPDTAPVVRIHEPGRDTALANGSGTIAVALDGRDDLGLASLLLRYTKVSGGGENVTFSEGTVPVTIERVSDREWRGRVQWALDGLGLAEGDALVYRAVARDRNPSGVAVQSDAFLIEVGRASEIASAGFALPSEERKYAISQQMVIYKTEQLLKARAQHATDWIEQTRMIGIEQRMVRAEVVFLSGGEVQDEVEEAAHSDELAEGRLENRGRAEMVRAINFMSRAEGQLNDGQAEQALVLERQALASLERALDRRRYFLRTLPDRSRIDATRRLTGDRREARPWIRDGADRPGAVPLQRHRAAMTELMSLIGPPEASDASVAARIAAIDPASPELQRAAVGVATARTHDERRTALRNAMQAVTAHALQHLPASTAVTIPADPLAGRLAEAIKR